MVNFATNYNNPPLFHLNQTHPPPSFPSSNTKNPSPPLSYTSILFFISFHTYIIDSLFPNTSSLSFSSPHYPLSVSSLPLLGPHRFSLSPFVFLVSDNPSDGGGGFRRDYRRSWRLKSHIIQDLSSGECIL